ncbi:MAG: prepilin peptidase [Candidatus Norongarragalinales archaeon]
MLNFELLRVAIAVVFTAIAAYQDNKTSYVDDKVLYALVGAGLLLNVLSFDFAFFVSTLPAALFIGVFGFVLWRRGSFGQGDVWLFLGLHLILPEYPSFVQLPLPSLPFVASVFLASSVFSLFGSSAFYAARLTRAKAFDKLRFASLVALSASSVFFLYKTPLQPLAKLFFSLFVISSVFLALFYRTIKEKVLIQWVSLKGVEDEDVLALEKLPSSFVKKHGLEKVVTKSVFQKLKALSKSGRMKKFPVFKNLIRFNPYVLAGLLVCLYAGDLLVWVLLG